MMLKMFDDDADSVAVFTGALGKTIADVGLKHDALHFKFSDGSEMIMIDDDQICCERRYMRTDDNLADFVGAKLLGAEVKDAQSGPHDDIIDGVHDVQFFELQTDRGVFTMASHNEHNGYYGSFRIRAVAARPS